jgi:hypothetical protein
MSLKVVVGGRAEILRVRYRFCSELDSDKGKWIIDVEPSATIATTKVHPSEPKELEEGKHIFHLQMWVKGAPLHFIIDNGSQKNLISAEFVKRLNLLMTPHLQLYTMGGSTKEEISTSTNNFVCPTTSSSSRMRYCVIFPPLKFVMLF